MQGPLFVQDVHDRIKTRTPRSSPSSDACLSVAAGAALARLAAGLVICSSPSVHSGSDGQLARNACTTLCLRHHPELT